MKYKFLVVLLAVSLGLISCASPQSSPTTPSTSSTPTPSSNYYTLMFVAGAQSTPVTFEVYDSYAFDHGGTGSSWGPAPGSQGVTNIVYSGTGSSVSYDWALGSFVSPVTVQCFALKNGSVVNSAIFVAPTSGTLPKFQGSM